MQKPRRNIVLVWEHKERVLLASLPKLARFKKEFNRCLMKRDRTLVRTRGLLRDMVATRIILIPVLGFRKNPSPLLPNQILHQ